MKNNEASTFVFIASIIIGILISMNISFTRTTDRVFLSAKQYQDSYNYKNKLYSDIAALIQQYQKYNSKLVEYKSNEKNEEQVTKGIIEELNENNIILGKVALEGQGIKISLNDAKDEDIENSFEFEKKLRLVHDMDIMQVINDIKNSGAEAISINGQRVVDRTEIYCSGAFLRINGVKMMAPFTIYAIGNKEVMYNYMLSNENYLKSLITRKVRVDVQQCDNLTVPAYIGEQKNALISSKNE
ncbi:division initiation protein [Clostridium carboxidivorans P7]|uniref:Division initiation protein n=1 Tax=Clostridium carboxidivorans P7 TaxID=536227 RepID=C6Q0P2_9CLOT|nr:DUF881 domain-containing protein [Clostridium carboxidivorans]AKN33989.1 division initiation protein [Clostridium carboxidivorans P7]EET84930.1 protein of unknown function DUF881 [Clostridium carboxidivorans P7]EFG87779.1 hypothetical protein CLCAR_2531 [Clostridium carboxidivorans P7]EFG88137.1 hypothetical protein CLCAR_2128 [Clostridium carboxidivorans P7]